MVYTATFEVFIYQDEEDNLFYAECPSLDLVDFGDTKEQAKSNFEVLLDMFFEDIIERGTFREVMTDLGWKFSDTLAAPRNRRPSPKLVSKSERLTEARQLAVAY
ncbi:MAG: type II toxin-antitoxin system HicB family antitoxin [Saprospiraceae bacterium]|nr:type II toxin-antitoxin system HicB family antitoxin [Saprospiraceae bacterium]MCB9320173.1 type II toxin-antitoxin system HicB family antitoxin [Lewinellaceae bacterium]